jgi:hypothetical protein
VNRNILQDFINRILGIESKKNQTFEQSAEVHIPAPPVVTTIPSPERYPIIHNTQQSPKPSIEWTSSPTQAKSPPTVPVPKPKVVGSTNNARIEWGNADQRTGDPATNLVGVEDAFDHTPLQPGEKVAFCTRDKVAYHLATWDFLRTQNQGKCCICGLSNVINLITLPGVAASSPNIKLPAQTRVSVMPGEQVISLAQVPNFIGRMVIIQDFVHEVYQTKSTGTFFVRFEPRNHYDPPFEGFKLVIFPDYQPNWNEVGISIWSYEKKYIRARGIVQAHGTWGIEILVNSPRVIEVVDGPKQN